MPDARAPAYPILAACIAQNRAPRPDELDLVADRIMREGFASRTHGDEIKTQRLAISAARIALLGGRRTG